MKKWNVKISFIIQADTRQEAYKITGYIIDKHLRDMASIDSIGCNPVSDPEQWIAVNQPIFGKTITT